jgi:hypothetical protein
MCFSDLWLQLGYLDQAAAAAVEKAIGQAMPSLRLQPPQIPF